MKSVFADVVMSLAAGAVRDVWMLTHVLVCSGCNAADTCEMCDDGNRRDNDGCSPECKFEDAYKCREGCSGPLCQTEDHCDESLIGDKLQVPCKIAPVP